MNVQNAPGRNWSRPSRRRSPVHLSGQPAGADPPALPTWLDRRGDASRRAPGRNWARERHAPRPVRLAHKPAALAALAEAPAREFGGGDHDRPYSYQPPSSAWTFPFSTREYARLLALRARLAFQAERQPGYQHDDFVGGRRQQLVGQSGQVAEGAPQRG
jgi:hypothetical protein